MGQYMASSPTPSITIALCTAVLALSTILARPAIGSPWIHETLTLRTHSDKNRDDAEDVCNGYNEVLAHVSNWEQWVNITTKLNGGGTFPNSDDDCWLDGSDESSEGNWRWHSGRLANENFFKESGSQFLNGYKAKWESGEPDDNLFGQDCLRIRGSNPKTLYDYQCTFYFRPQCSVCVKEWCNGDDDCFGHGVPDVAAGRTYYQGCGSCNCDQYYSGTDCSIYTNPNTGTTIRRYTVGFGNVAYKTYAQAVSHCSGLGGGAFLAQPGDAAEMGALGTSRGDACWIGGSYTSSTSSYTYATSAGRNGGKTLRTGSTNAAKYSTLPFSTVNPSASNAPLMAYADTSVSYSDQLTIASSQTAQWSYTSLRCWYCMWQACANRADCSGNAVSVSGPATNCVCVCKTGYLQHRKCSTETITLAITETISLGATKSLPVTTSTSLPTTASTSIGTASTSHTITMTPSPTQTLSASHSYHTPSYSSTSTMSATLTSSYTVSSTQSSSVSATGTNTISGRSFSRTETLSGTGSASPTLSLSTSLSFSQSATDSGSGTVSDTHTATDTTSISAPTPSISPSETQSSEITRTRQCALHGVLSYMPLFQTLPLGPSILLAAVDKSSAFASTSALGCPLSESNLTAEERYLRHVLLSQKGEAVRSILGRVPAWVAPSQAAVFVSTRAERDQLLAGAFALTQTDINRFAGIQLDPNTQSTTTTTLGTQLRRRGATVGVQMSTSYLKGLVGSRVELRPTTSEQYPTVAKSIVGTLFSVGDGSSPLAYPSADNRHTTPSAIYTKSDLRELYAVYKQKALDEAGPSVQEVGLRLQGRTSGTFPSATRTQLLSHVESVYETTHLEASLSSLPSWGTSTNSGPCLPNSPPTPTRPAFVRSKAAMLFPAFITSQSGGRPRGLSSLIPKVALPPGAGRTQKRLLANTVAVVVIEAVTPLTNTSYSLQSLDMCSRDPTCVCLRDYLVVGDGTSTSSLVSFFDMELSSFDILTRLHQTFQVTKSIPCSTRTAPLSLSSITTDHVELAVNTIVASTAVRVSTRVWWPYSEPIDPVCATMADLLGIDDSSPTAPFGMQQRYCSAPRDVQAVRGYESYYIEEDETVATRLFLDTLASALPLNSNSSGTTATPRPLPSPNATHPCIIDPEDTIVDLPLLTVAAPEREETGSENTQKSVQGAAAAAVALSGLAGGGLAGDLQSVMALKMIPCGQPRQQQTRDPNTGRIVPTSGYRGLTPIALSNDGFGLPQTIDAMRLGALDSTFVHEYNHVDRGLSSGGIWSVFTRGLFPSTLLSILSSLGVTATSSDDLQATSPGGSGTTVINTTAATQGTAPLEMCPDGSLSSLRGASGGFYTHGAAGALIPNFAVLIVLLVLLSLNTIRVRRRVLQHLTHRDANPFHEDGPCPALDSYDPRIQTRWDTTCALAFSPTLFFTLTMAILPGIAIASTLLYLDRMSVMSLHEIVEREGYPGSISSRMLNVCEGASTVTWTTPTLDDSVILPPSTTNWDLQSCFVLRASGAGNASGTTVHVDASRFYCKGGAELDDNTILSTMVGPSVLEMTIIPQTHLLPPNTLNNNSASQLRIWFAAQSQIDMNLALSHLRSASQAANEPVVNLLTPLPTDDNGNYYGIAATATAEPTTSSYFSTEDINRIKAAANEVDGWLALCIVAWALIATIFVTSQAAAASLTTRRFHRLAYDRWIVPNLTMTTYTLTNCRHTFIHHDNGICKKSTHRNPNSIDGSLEQSHLYKNGFTSLPVRTLLQIRRHEEINEGWGTTTSTEDELEMALLGGSDKQSGGIISNASSIPFQVDRPIPTKELIWPYIRYVVVTIFFPIGQLDIYDAPSSKMFSKFVSKTRFRHPMWSLFHFTFLIAIVPLTISAIGMQQRLNEYDGIAINAQGLYSGDSSSRQQTHPFTPPTDFTAEQTSRCVATYVFTAVVQLFSVLVLLGFRPHVTLFVNIVDAGKLSINAILYLNTAVSVAESVSRQRESEQRGNQLSDLSTTVSKCLDKIPRPPGCDANEAETLLSWQAEMSSQYGTLRAPPTLPGFLDEPQTHLLTNILIALTVIHLCHLLVSKLLLFATTIPVPDVLKQMIPGHDWFDFLPDDDVGCMDSGSYEGKNDGHGNPPPLMLADALSRTKSSDTNIELLPPTPSTSSSKSTFSTTSSRSTTPAQEQGKNHKKNKKKGETATLTKIGVSYDSTLSLPSSLITTPVKQSIDDISLDLLSSSGNQQHLGPKRTTSGETLSSMGLRTPLESLPITPATTGGGKVFTVPFPSPPVNHDTPLGNTNSNNTNSKKESGNYKNKDDIRDKKRSSSIISINRTPSKATTKPNKNKHNKAEQQEMNTMAPSKIGIMERKTHPSIKTRILEKAAGDGVRYLLPPVVPAPISCSTWEYNTRAFPLPHYVADLEDWQLAQLLSSTPSKTAAASSLSRQESTKSQNQGGGGGESAARLRGNTMKYDIDWQKGISEHELQELTDRKQAITLTTQDDVDDLGTFDSLDEAEDYHSTTTGAPHQQQQEDNNVDDDGEEEEEDHYTGMSTTLANRIKEYKKFSSSMLDEKALPRNNKNKKSQILTTKQRHDIPSSSSLTRSMTSSSSFESNTAAATSSSRQPALPSQSKRRQPNAFRDGDWI